MSRHSVKDRIKYKDISWLMPSVDVVASLEKLGVQGISRTGDEITAYCPDHHIFTGNEPSHPKWTLNVKNGKTFCFTEGRGSNLLWIISRVLDVSADEAMKFLCGENGDIDVSKLRLDAMKRAKERLLDNDEEDDTPRVSGLSSVRREMERGCMSPEAYEFFMSPPGKKHPTNICKDTVDHYQVFERTWGYYVDTVVIPFVQKGVLMGFSATDILGKEEWLFRHPTKSENEYKKTRFPSGFKTREFLFGYDDCQEGADFLIVTEGPREVMKLWQEGFTNSVAVLGSFMGDTQMELLSSLAPKKVVLMFDGDSAGDRAAEGVGKKLENLVEVVVCRPPEGMDPKNLERRDFEKMIFGK